MSNSTSFDPFGRTLRITATSVYAITILAGLLGNGIGLYIVLRKTGTKSVANMLIGNMALADLLTCLFAMPHAVVFLYVQNQWFGGIMGLITCKLNQFPFMLSIIASVLTIFVISVGRYFAVFHPLKGKFLRKPRLMTFFIWGVSVLITCPTVYPYQLYQRVSGGPFYCVVEWPGSLAPQTNEIQQIYYLLIFVVLYCVPLATTSIIYFAIGWRLWKRRVPGYELDANKEAAAKTKNKVIKMLVVIVVIFAICWAPVHIMHYYMSEPEWFTIPMWIKLLSFWVAHLNSAINPYIYIVFNDSFRKEFKDILSSCNMTKLWRRSSSYLTSTTAIKATGSTMSSTFKTSRKGLVRIMSRNHENAKEQIVNYGGTTEEPGVQLLERIVTSDNISEHEAEAATQSFL